MYKIPESFIFAFVSKEKKNELPRAAQRPSLSMGMYVWNYEGEKWKKKKEKKTWIIAWNDIPSRGVVAQPKSLVVGTNDIWQKVDTRPAHEFLNFYFFFWDFMLIFYWHFFNAHFCLLNWQLGRNRFEAYVFTEICLACVFVLGWPNCSEAVW